MAPIKKTLAASLAALTLTSGGVLAASQAYANPTDAEPTAIEAQSTQNNQSHHRDHRGSGGEGTHERGAHERGPRGMRGPRGLKAIIELLDVTPQELRTARQDGKTLVEFAAEKGVSEQQLVDAIYEHMAERVAQAVSDGYITQEKADEKLSDAKERITERINQDPSQRPEHHERKGFAPRGSNSEETPE